MRLKTYSIRLDVEKMIELIIITICYNLTDLKSHELYEVLLESLKINLIRVGSSCVLKYYHLKVTLAHLHLTAIPDN